MRRPETGEARRFLEGFTAGTARQQPARWAPYQVYLTTIRARLGPRAAAFALAPWHYDPRDSRCPHDAWVEWVTVRESAAGARAEVRGLEIEVRLLGAYHDGRAQLVYRGVRSYTLAAPAGAPRPGMGHGDWLIDELRLADDGGTVHEVVFERAFPVVYPLLRADNPWLPEVDRALLPIADAVYGAAPFALALVGEEASGHITARELTAEYVAQAGGCLLPPRLARRLGLAGAAAVVLPTGLRWFSHPADPRDPRPAPPITAPPDLGE